MSSSSPPKNWPGATSTAAPPAPSATPTAVVTSSVPLGPPCSTAPTAPGATRSIRSYLARGARLRYLAGRPAGPAQDEEQQRWEDHESVEDQEPGFARVAAGPDRVGDRQQPEDGRQPVDAAPAGGADAVAEVVGDT